ncbi:hypothetical protein PVAP13_9KG401800 [Panicum virgatum]|uniref:Peptidase C14 caspase domain-containing protein n=1 Tax=Panicum virgatum TaxID=38727 RepID=A0A8T0NXX1_PANVG|nr:hypothetical protein PVAP13_9KG401800 [Panicum virgatum]
MSNFGGRPHGGHGTATIPCKYCRAPLSVIPGERAIQCAHCNCVTRIRRADRIPLPVMGPLTAPFQRARGKKRAVLVGITYAGGMRRGCGELRGPINDVKCMRNLLCQRFGFPAECIIMLTDDQRDPFRLPTKDNIRMAMQWLVQGCSYGDSLVFHFSGIGAQVADDDGDEVDGYDEALCPMDAFQRGPILDDEINEAIVRPLVHGVRLHAVVDASYSATVLDLPFLCRVARNGYWQWEDQRPPSGAWKGTSGGQAVLFSGYSDGKSNFAVVDAGRLRIRRGHDAQLRPGGGVRAARGHIRPPAHLHEDHHEVRRRRGLRRPAGTHRRADATPPGRQLQRRAGA